MFAKISKFFSYIILSFSGLRELSDAVNKARSPEELKDLLEDKI